MGWGTPYAEQKAAQDAADVAVERAEARHTLTPFQTQLLDVLGEIRDALQQPATVCVEESPLAGGEDPPDTPAGEHLWPRTCRTTGEATGPMCSCDRPLLPVRTALNWPHCDIRNDPITGYVHAHDDSPACKTDGGDR